MQGTATPATPSMVTGGAAARKGKKGKRTNNDNDGDRLDRKGKGKGNNGKPEHCNLLSSCMSTPRPLSSKSDGTDDLSLSSLTDVDKNLSVLRYLYDFYARLLAMTSHSKLTVMLNEASVKCISDETKTALRQYRDVLEDIESTKLKRIWEEHNYYTDLKAQRRKDKNPLTDSSGNAMTTTDTNLLQKLLLENKLNYENFPLMIIMEHASKIARDKITVDLGAACTPKTVFHELYFSPKDKTFFAKFGCQDTMMDVIVKFAIVGGFPKDVSVVADINATDVVPLLSYSDTKTVRDAMKKSFDTARRRGNSSMTTKRRSTTRNRSFDYGDGY